MVQAKTNLEKATSSYYFSRSHIHQEGGLNPLEVETKCIKSKINADFIPGFQMFWLLDID